MFEMTRSTAGHHWFLMMLVLCALVAFMHQISAGTVEEGVRLAQQQTQAEQIHVVRK